MPIQANVINEDMIELIRRKKVDIEFITRPKEQSKFL